MYSYYVVPISVNKRCVIPLALCECVYLCIALSTETVVYVFILYCDIWSCNHKINTTTTTTGTTRCITNVQGQVVKGQGQIVRCQIIALF